MATLELSLRRRTGWEDYRRKVAGQLSDAETVIRRPEVPITKDDRTYGFVLVGFVQPVIGAVATKRDPGAQM